MEIERKFLIRELPGNLNDYYKREIEQVYLCRNPVLRVRKADDSYYLTYKGTGKMVREEYNMPLTASSYLHLKKKADGHPITKTRYLIPLEDGLMGELDVFHGILEGLMFMEVEFRSEDEAFAYEMPDWVERDVTMDDHYHNSYLSTLDSYPW